MLASHAQLVVGAVDGHVLGLAGREFLHGGLNGLHATLSTSLLGGNVGVQTGAVPVTRNGLGGKSDLGTKLLGNAVEDKARNPELVAKLDVFARANLVFPLSRHDLGIGSGDVDVGVQAGLVVRLDNVTAEDLASAYTAVVWALRGGEAVLGPAIGPAKLVEEGVFLLETEPELVLGVGLEDNGGVVAEVVRVGLAIRHVGLAHDEDVVTQTEGVREEVDGAEVDIGVFARRLAC